MRNGGGEKINGSAEYREMCANGNCDTTKGMMMHSGLRLTSPEHDLM